jgi:hypothetical protein
MSTHAIGYNIKTEIVCGTEGIFVPITFESGVGSA